MRSIFLEAVKELLWRCAEYIMNFVDLVELVVSWEQRKEAQNFEEDAANSPDVHFVTVVAVGHEALGCAVPSGRDVLGKRRFIVEPSATSEVGQLDRLVRQQNVLRLDVSVENPVTVHMLDSLQKLVNPHLDLCFWEVVGPPFDRFVEVHLHELKDKREPASGLVIEHLD